MFKKTSILLASLLTMTSFATILPSGALDSKHKAVDMDIIHINDHHSYLEPHQIRMNINGKNVKVKVGGFSAVNHKIKELKEKATNPLILHAGDAITGTLYFTLFGGSADAEVMNLGGFDYFTLGNHEFDAGNEGLLKLLEPLTIPVLSANVIPDKTSILYNKWKPYDIFYVDGEKIGIIGLDTVKKTINSSSPGKDIKFEDEIETSRKMADLLKQKGVNKIILLSHAGTEKNFEIAQKVNNIDIIITGDSHYLYGNDELRRLKLPVIHEYPMEFKSPNGEPVYVVEAWAYSGLVGDLGVHFTKDGIASITKKDPYVLLHEESILAKNKDGKWAPLEGKEKEETINYLKTLKSISFAKEDKATSEVLKRYKEEKDKLSKQVVGTIKGNIMLGGSENRIPGREGSNPEGSVATRFVAETMLNQIGNVDYTIQNAGGVRANITPGDVTYNDAYTYLPFGNTLYTYRISGADTKQVLEDALQYALVDGSTGAFPYGANIRYEANEVPNEEGKRLVDVEVFNKKTGQWEKIKDDQYYLLGTNVYIASGKDGYKTFARLYKDPKAEGVDTFLPDAESFIKFLKEHPNFEAYKTSNVKFNNKK